MPVNYQPSRKEIQEMCNDKSLHKRAWSSEEDDRLSSLVAEYGLASWSLIAEKIGSRSGKQCRERYHNHLQGGIRKGAWSEEEDRIIATMQAQIGNQWAKIASFLPGRTDNSVKNRWHAASRSATGTNALVAKANKDGSLLEELTKSDVIRNKLPCVPKLDLAKTNNRKKKELSPTSQKINEMTADFNNLLYSHSMHAHEPTLSSRSDLSSSRSAMAISPTRMQTYERFIDDIVHMNNNQSDSESDSEYIIPEFFFKEEEEALYCSSSSVDSFESKISRICDPSAEPSPTLLLDIDFQPETDALFEIESDFDSSFEEDDEFGPLFECFDDFRPLGARPGLSFEGLQIGAVKSPMRFTGGQSPISRTTPRSPLYPVDLMKRQRS